MLQFTDYFIKIHAISILLLHFELITLVPLIIYHSSLSAFISVDTEYESIFSLKHFKIIKTIVFIKKYIKKSTFIMVIYYRNFLIENNQLL